MGQWPLIELDDTAILYIDDDIVAVDKEAGDLCDASVDPNRDHLGKALKRWAVSAGHRGDFYPAHRLDRPTSGIVLFARHKTAATSLMEQFQSRTTTKRYQAIVRRPDASWKPGAEFERRSYLRHRKGISEEVRSGGKPAHSRFIVEHHAEPLALVEANPLTGRTHQLRVHLAALGAPIVGDDRYGGPDSLRLWLHAWSLNVEHPATDVGVSFESRSKLTLTARGPAIEPTRT